jgi:hypothetical protein
MSTKGSKREIFGWAMFDFANSSYTTVIITVVYSTIFVKLVVGDGNGSDQQYARGNLMWDIGLFISYILCVVTGPSSGPSWTSARPEKIPVHELHPHSCHNRSILRSVSGHCMAWHRPAHSL